MSGEGWTGLYVEKQEGKAVLEALLFAAGESVSVEELAEILAVDPGRVRSWLKELQEEYEADTRGLVIRKVAGGYELSTHSLAADYVTRLLSDPARNRLSQAALETLSIVAYKQPVTRAEVDAIRGVKSTRALQTLLDRELIQEEGRKETIGRPILYGTTRKFLEYFGLESLDDLPEVE